jgi:hypothetical protein
MATVSPSTAGRVEVVEWPKAHEQLTLNAAAALNAGTFVRPDTNGAWVQAIATTASNVAGVYFAPRTVIAGEPLTGMKTCTVAGFTVSQAEGAQLYVSDTGTLADAAGTVSTSAGRVIPGRANQPGAAADKLVRIDLPN